MERRAFLMNSGAFCLLGSLNLLPFSCKNIYNHRMKIAHTASVVEKEPLIQPFGFKGGYLTELWQSVVRLTGSGGNHAIGLGTQSVLWSDSEIFQNNSETDGNRMMYAITERALKMIEGMAFDNPIALQEDILEEVHDFGKRITGKADLRKTFTLNALVPVDNALWILFAKENGIGEFDSMIPAQYHSTLSQRHKKVASIPLISYGTSPEELKEIAESGYFFFKIKIGQPGNQAEMLEKDKARLSEIHRVLSSFQTPYTKNGKLVYYLDANGRYEKEETFLSFLDYADKIGALEHIAIIEEPYPEELEIDVSDIPVRLVSDETAHTEADVLKRIEMGYRAIALKPIAKTLSMTLKIAKTAKEHGVPCFCADLTVNPVLVEWNKSFAARLNTFPGLDNIGLLESNGKQNYRNWNKMMEHFPAGNKPWIEPAGGIYTTNDEFFKTGGGIFENLRYYEGLFDNFVPK